MYQPAAATQNVHNSSTFPRKPLSPAYKVFTVIYTMLLDVLVYATIFPLIGIYLSGACAKTFHLSPKFELVLTVILTFILVYGAFTVSLGELAFWKHLFTLDPFYCNILKIRDGTNSIVGILALVSLSTTVQSMVDDRYMKPLHVSEGTGYFFMKTFFGWLQLDQAVMPHLGLKLPHEGTVLDPDFGENGRYENGAAYIYFWAVLSACVSKMLYFNTLFTYLMSIEIFMSMNPSFDDDDDDE